MPYKYLCSLVSLAVVLGGCKKDEPKPDPYQAMLGDWSYAYSKLYFYDVAGTLVDQLKSPPIRVQRAPMHISATFFEGYISNLFYSPSDLIPYTRQGDQLTITFPPSSIPPTRTISRLTSDSLTLDTPLISAPYNQFILIKEHYARQ